MNKIINRYQAVCGVTWIIICCIIITLWPLRLITEKIVSGSNQQISMQSEAITNDYVVELDVRGLDGANYIRAHLYRLRESDVLVFAVHYERVVCKVAAPAV